MRAIRHPGMTWLVFVVLTAACARPRVALGPPEWPLATCRRVVDPAGRETPVTVFWHVAHDSRSRDAMGLLCGTVGPAVFGGPDAHAPPEITPDGIVVATWNVHVGGGDLSAFIDALSSGRLTAGAPVRHFVLLLQEVFRRGPDVPPVAATASTPERIEGRTPTGTRDEVIAIARARRLSVFYLPSMRNGRDTGASAEDRGNAILSTLRLSDPAGIELPFTRQRRVAPAANVGGVHVTGQPWRLRVVSAHLDASSGAARLWLFSDMLRGRQASRLVEVLDGDLPTVIGADLNTWEGATDEPAYLTLRRAFPHGNGPDRATYRFGLLLDYLFFRVPVPWAAESRTLSERFGSDHRPLIGRIRF
jgi:endonuclease/exonuclease/phosphatase family metal-dependent hydrolase